MSNKMNVPENTLFVQSWIMLKQEIKVTFKTICAQSKPMW